MNRQNWKKQHALILTGSFLIPVILMGAYFAYRQMAPFGPSSLLTVDLGQQYVDFFAYFRNIILHHPSALFYSFSKGLGGEMLGTNAYYLFSPLNLILLFFPGKWLTSGIMVLTLVRYGLAGLTFAWLLLRTRLQNGFRIWAFSTAYALNGWMIANQLNMIWLDAMIILPLIIWGLLKLIHDGRLGTYIAWLAVMMIDNYYMAWMICLFTILVVLWQLPTLADWRTRLRATGRYLASSVASAGIAAITLLPTFYALTTSKGTYTETAISSKLEYQPLKMLGKLVPGSFDFNQMPSGQPNIYIGMLLMIGAGLYFFNSRVKWSQRLVAGLVTIFFILSFCYEPLDLLWHAGQFPVWYPYRFSFIFAFWCILLAARVLQPSYQLQWPGALAILIISGLVFWLTGQLKLSYLSTSQRLIGLGFVVVSLAALMIARRNSPRLYDFLIVLIVACDVGTSAFTSLNKIAYVSQDEFGKYTQQLDQASRQLKRHDSGFYRIAKTFMRTKDDPMQGDFYSADHFGSTLEPPIPAFMGAIGQPAGDGFVSYDNGTQVSDALLGFKYTMTARHHGIENGDQIMPLSGYRPDWTRLPKVDQTKMITSRKNAAALPIAFGASSEIFQLGKATLDPLSYQSQIFQALAGRPINQPLFTVQNFTSVQFNNVQAAHQITGTTFRKQNLLKPATIKLKFTPPTNDSYYLTLGPEVKDSATISLNRRDFSQYDTYRDTVVINLAHHQKGKPVTITFRLKKTSARLQNVSVYCLKQRAFNNSLKALQQSPLKIQKATPTSIKGTVHIHHGQSTLMTTIPAATGWHVRIDGQRVQPRTVISTFMALPITSGTHQVEFYYRPPFLILGAVITVISLGLTCYVTRRQRY
ncbi:MAG: YfhO family protein [Lactobacillaceae bacterium]|uniref:YfhO family protein n=1 Tax=Limosilactobacillus sp. TaxID=2773925 RepID=UPI002A7608D1|nr:YfhO family protein [Limosilactobacillus sp.]MDD7692816.1 YfhO family protein [Lactobacillaceae bacterium]MDY2803594.1 YfhO family protein [Limosilactobacillus sp.]